MKPAKKSSKNIGKKLYKMNVNRQATTKQIIEYQNFLRKYSRANVGCHMDV